VKASHLLIKHSGSRRPSSWKDPNITRSKDEAIEILKGHQAALKQAVDLEAAFATLASTESDCSSARDGGDLGAFCRRVS
jgi:NIMA-interacting peptidyl-prolyl cis-trans isomerase 1